MVHAELPGSELLEEGLLDLRSGKLSPLALALCALRSRLNVLGLNIELVELPEDAEILMYHALGAAGEANPHSAMNAIFRRLDAYASAAEARRFRAVTPED